LVCPGSGDDNPILCVIEVIFNDCSDSIFR
jgi:hypothetical protein